MSVLILIPARKGSKRLPGKNSRPFAGMPLIAWTIKAALSSNLEADVVVSTDSEKIAELSKEYGALIPFIRPEELAADTSPGIDVINHALDTLNRKGKAYKYIILLQPTSPLRQSWHVTEALNMLQENSIRSVISVTKVSHPIEWTLELSQSNSMDSFIDEQLPLLKNRSQELQERYRINGAIYAARVDDLIKEQSFYMSSGVMAYKMEKQYSVDIDDIDDFKYAENLMLLSLKEEMTEEELCP
ncbi:MAG: acylneuraminate cytidylyltransferase family protein [Methyloprofundus sp.]|nr:acylneuraminate cytidylyltransferase family protein [Methyloprofundus sp.]